MHGLAILARAFDQPHGVKQVARDVHGRFDVPVTHALPHLRPSADCISQSTADRLGIAIGRFHDARDQISIAIGFCEQRRANTLDRLLAQRAIRRCHGAVFCRWYGVRHECLDEIPVTGCIDVAAAVKRHRLIGQRARIGLRLFCRAIGQRVARIGLARERLHVLRLHHAVAHSHQHGLLHA